MGLVLVGLNKFMGWGAGEGASAPSPLWIDPRGGSGDISCWPESPALSVIGEIAEMNIGEVQLGPALGIEVQTDPFIGEGFTNVIVLALVRQVAARGNHFYFKVGRIDQRFVVLVEPAAAGLVKLGRTLLIE